MDSSNTRRAQSSGSSIVNFAIFDSSYVGKLFMDVIEYMKENEVDYVARVGSKFNMKQTLSVVVLLAKLVFPNFVIHIGAYVTIEHLC